MIPHQEKVWDSLYSKNKNLWSRQAHSLPKICKGKRVLELGVGNGKTLKSILAQKPSSLTAIDISQQALSLCQSSPLFTEVQFIHSSVTSLPFPDSSFDIVVCYYILNNLSPQDQSKALDEIHRVLKKGGFLLFQDFAAGDFREKEHSRKLSPHTYLLKDGRYCHFFTIPEVKKLFSSFSSIELEKKKSYPIHRRKDLVRKLIAGLAKKT